MHASNTAERQLAPADFHSPLRSILVATDLSGPERNAVQRAARLATAHRSTLTLMYLPARAQDLHAGDARLLQAASQLEQTLGVRVRAVRAKRDAWEDLVAHAVGADLAVLPHRREFSTAAFFRGQPVLRLLRRCERPVLVARRPADEDYRRMLVPVDWSAESQALVKFAGDACPGALLEVFHAVSTHGESMLRSAEATEHAIRAYRDRMQRHARSRIDTITDAFTARRNRVLATVGRGDPGRQAVVQQEHSDADLVVVGKRPASAWEDFLCGSVAHRVLSWGSSDVLVVPHSFLRPATAAPAPRPLRREAAARA